MATQKLLFGGYIASVPNISQLRQYSTDKLNRGDLIGTGGQNVLGDLAGGIYVWNADDIRDDDNDTIVKPLNLAVGRWNITNQSGGPTGATGPTGLPGGNVMAIGPFTNAGSLTISVGTDLVQTSGYSAAGKGAALYAYSASVNGDYVAGNTRHSFMSANGRGFVLYGSVVDLSQIGALGDGNTDDAPAIQYAMDRFTTVTAPAGTFLAGNNIVCPARDGFSFTGQGRNTKITGGNGGGLLYIQSCDRIYIADIWLDCNTVSQGNLFSFGTDVSNALFERIHFTNSNLNTNAVKFVADNSVVGFDGVEFRGCTFESIGRMGIEIQDHAAVHDRVRARRIVIDGCTMAGVGSMGDGKGISLSGPLENCQINGNTIGAYYGAGIELVGPSVVRVSNNTLIDAQSGAYGFSVSNEILMSGVTITNNTVVGGAIGGVLFASLKHGQITDNYFDLRSGSGVVTLTTQAVGSADNFFTSNTVLTAGSYAVINDNLPGTTITDNILDNSASTASFATLRLNSTGSTNVYYARNSITPATTGSATDEQNGATANKSDSNIIRRSGQTPIIQNPGGALIAAVNYDPASIAANSNIQTTVTLAASVIGGFAVASFDQGLNGIQLFSEAKAGQIIVTFTNPTSAAIDLPAGVLRVRFYDTVS